MHPKTFLVFDLDGTLSDPAVGIGRSINFALAHFGYPTIASGDVSHYIGPPLDVSFASITGSASPTHVAELVSKYRERYADVGYSENVLYAGIPEALEALATDGVPMGLCTSKRVDFAEGILQLFSLQQISPTSIMVGDRAVDVESAKANGLQSVGVLWGHGSEEELTRAGPLRLLASPHQLVELVSLLETPR
jgi:phosphoglycolate phosphatase